MGTANTSQFHYLARLQFLKKRYQETEDPKEKRRIGSLLDGEEDCVTLIDCTKRLKTEAARELISRAALLFITRHVLNLSAEFKGFK
jgi:hypothetical protein